MDDDAQRRARAGSMDRPSDEFGAVAAVLRRAGAVLEDPRRVAAAACVMALPLLSSFGRGFTIDEHLQYQMVRRGTRAPWDLFRFADSARDTLDKVRRGELPWFFSEDAKSAFFRPLPSLAHFAEYRLFGSHAWLYHAHNMLWFGALVATVHSVLRSFEGRRWTVGLGTLLYVCSPAVAVCTAWISARNALMAAVFGFAALGAHHAWREHRSAGPGPALALSVASLACGESSAGSFAYLVGYAALYERGPVLRRFASVAPYVALAATWYGAEHALGYGSSGHSLYADIESGAAAFVPVLGIRLVRLVELELGWSGVEALAGRFRESSAEPGLPMVVGVVLALALVIAWAARERAVRFWFASALLSALPFCLAIPQPRLLLTAHLGISAGLACAARALAFRRDDRAPSLGAILRAAGIPALVAATVGLGWPCTIAQYFDIGVTGPIEMAASRFMDSFAGKDVVCVNGDLFMPHTAVMIQEERGVRPAKSALVLVSSPAFGIERSDPNTLVVRGAASLLGVAGDLLRSAPFHVGDRIRSARAEIEILRVSSEQKPTSVRFVFDTSLDDPSLAWMTMLPSGFAVPVEPIPIGSRFVVVNGVAVPGF